jgi:hypothetical protein
MIRVQMHPKGSAAVIDISEDFDATSAQVGGDGSLVLAKVEVRYARENPADLSSKFRTEISNPQLVAIIAPGQWGRVDNLDVQDAAEGT